MFPSASMGKNEENEAQDEEELIDKASYEETKESHWLGRFERYPWGQR